MKAIIETITPETATVWLAATSRQRPISPALVRRYADDLRAGQWALNGESIILSDDGQVLDGQHRLLAIQEALCPMRTFVVHGVVSQSFVTIDSGRPRGGSDMLALSGFLPDWRNPKHAAAVVQAMATNGSRKLEFEPLSRTHFLLVSAVYRPAMQALLDHRDRLKFGGGGGLSALTIAAAVAAIVDAGWSPDIETFLYGVATGYVEDAMHAGSAAVSARNLWLSSSRLNGRMVRGINYLKTQRCLQAFLRRETLTKVYTPSMPVWDVSINSDWWRKHASPVQVSSPRAKPTKKIQ